LTGPAGEADDGERFIREHGLEMINFRPMDNLRRLPELMRRLRLFISTDSGPRHLAAAVGCPTVALYGWNDPRRWGAYFDPDKHSAVCVGDPVTTADEREADPAQTIRRISVDLAFDVARRRLIESP
jgi:ADP-heptose:LPS heptosyltransferase